MKKVFRFRTVLGIALVIGLLAGGLSASAEPWKFGVMADTQWKGNLDGENPETVAVGIINQLNQQFIDHGVKFVIQVGDLVDKETDGPNGLPSNRTMDTRALAAQALYDAGIGFYPLRGNHEGSQTAGREFQTLYPQTTGSGPYVFGTTSFSSPFDTLKGLSYSFDYDNARFLILDQFTRTDGTNYLGSTNNNIMDQQSWINDRLSSKPVDAHGFVFSHKNLIGQNHADDLFGTNSAYDVSGNVAARDAFITSLMQSGVRCHFSGHDHMHHRSIVASPDAASKVQEIICASNSYKFYVPQDPSNDETYNVPAFGGSREIPIAQELFAVGYYIVTVDGPRVTVDYYASPNGCDGDCDLTVTPILTFSKRETFGYGLNGREFLVPQGESYAGVQDRFRGTTAKILSGTNSSTATASDGRALTKAVDTGWTSVQQRFPRFWPWFHKKPEFDLASNVLTLLGMADLGNDHTDTYTLSMTYEPAKAWNTHLFRGGFGIATKDHDGEWVNAVDLNSGGVKKFVLGPWKVAYGLGTYGIDLRTRTAWAVIDYDGDFAVARDIEPVQGHRK